MFKKPTLLNKDEHKNLKIAPMTHYKHARGLNYVPIAMNEVSEACKHYPVFFLKESDGTVLPFIVLGLKEGENKIVNKSGEWRKGRYIPALCRAYPFILSKNDDNFSVAFDAEYDGLNAKDGERLMTDAGEMSEFGQKVVKFLEELYSNLEGTKNLAKVLDEMELLKQVDATIEQNGEKFVLAGLLQVDSEKLNKLNDEQILKLAKTGALNLSYAHLMSLTNFQNLV